MLTVLPLGKGEIEGDGKQKMILLSPPVLPLLRGGMWNANSAFYKIRNSDANFAPSWEGGDGGDGEQKRN